MNVLATVILIITLLAVIWFALGYIALKVYCKYEDGPTYSDEVKTVLIFGPVFFAIIIWEVVIIEKIFSRVKRDFDITAERIAKNMNDRYND